MGYFLPGFDAERLATQQSVVRAERRQRYEDVPYGAARFAVARALWSEGHPLRHMTIGRHEDIQAATVDDVAAFYRTWYVPANATLVIAGDLDDAAVDALLDRYFGSFPTSTRPTRPTPTPLPLAPAHRETVPDRFAALARIHRAWHAPAAFAADEAELDVLVAGWTAVGTGTLWRRLVYETQLAQRVSAWTACGRLGGELHVSVDLRSGADPAAVRAILDDEHARAIAARDADDDQRQITRVVTRREAAVVWSLASVSKRAAAIQRYMLYTGEPDGFAADLARYRAVTPASIAAATARWLAAPFVEIETVPAS
jgi:zinc protease